MKVVIGIVLISLVILGLIAYMILMLNAREMIFLSLIHISEPTRRS